MAVQEVVCLICSEAERAEVKVEEVDGHVAHPVLMQRIGSHVLSQSNSIVLDLNFFLELVNFAARMNF